MSSFSDANSATDETTIERQAAFGQACPLHHLEPIYKIHQYLFKIQGFLAAMVFLVVPLAESHVIGDGVGIIGFKA